MRKKVALFPGQGSVYIGMGKSLCEKYETARRTFEEASDAISIDLKKMCFAGNLEELIRTENAQPAILTTSVTAFRVLQEKTGFQPHYYAGHSLGEFSALTCAGSIKFSDAVKLGRKRGELMAAAVLNTEGLMTAVGKVPVDFLQSICARISKGGDSLCVSNYNSPMQNVISGTKEAIIEAEKELVALGASVKRLNVSTPFHSPLMKHAAEQFRAVLMEYNITPPTAPIISNVTARPHDAEHLRECLEKQIASPVRWEESMEYLASQQVRLAIDVGPGKIVKNLFRSNCPSINVKAYDIPDEAIETEKLIDLDKPIPFVSRCMGLAVSSRNHCQDSSYYESHVLDPFRRLQQIQNAIEADGREATADECRLAEKILTDIMKAKGLTQSEMTQKLERLYLDT